MMMMTIWWSKATRLLEFSRSVSLDLRTRLFCDEDEEELRILEVGFVAVDAIMDTFEIVRLC